MTKYSDYRKYFEGIATLYCQHTEQEKHFFRKGLDEFLNGLSTDVNYPAMLLENYDFKFIDNGADSVNKDRTIAFLIIDHVTDMKDYEQIEQKKDLTEEIVDKIYNQIREDKYYPKNDFLLDANLNGVQVSPIENYADGNIGYFVTIEISSFHNTTVV